MQAVILTGSGGSSTTEKKIKDQQESVYVEPAQLILGLRSLTPLDIATNRLVWKHDRRMAAYHNNSGTKFGTTNTSTSQQQQQQPSSGAAKLASLLKQAQSNPEILSKRSTTETLAGIIARQMLLILLRLVAEDVEVDLSQSLADAGLDSLVAIKMRGWWRTSFGTEISVLEMLSIPNLLSLGEVAARRLRARFAGLENDE